MMATEALTGAAELQDLDMFESQLVGGGVIPPISRGGEQLMLTPAITTSQFGHIIEYFVPLLTHSLICTPNKNIIRPDV